MYNKMENTIIDKPAPKKRGRKRKEECVLVPKDTPEEKPVQKKRGRKPKGGKILVKDEQLNDEPPIVSNVILHLKCNSKDVEQQNIITELAYNPEVPPDIETYQQPSEFTVFDSNNITYTHAYDSNTNSINQNQQLTNEQTTKVDNIDVKMINDKLKNLKIRLHKGDISSKCACFWCSYEFDTPACAIPMEFTDYEIIGYGCFCTPQCATAYLFNEHIDDATRFERYQLLNNIYSKVYNYHKNIKPAPNPHYILDKFYGNMSISEFRKLLGTDHLLVLLDKPMTRHIPELCDDNDHFVNSIYNDSTTVSKNTSKYKVKRESEKKKGPTKKELIKEHFGL
jgi:hypothetical protein